MPFARRAILPEDLPPPATGVTADILNAMPRPDSMPLFSGLRVAADDRLWVQKYRASQDESQEWVALGDAGDVVASLRLDASMQVLDIGPDYVIVLTTDELDVPLIRMYGLVTRPN